MSSIETVISCMGLQNSQFSEAARHKDQVINNVNPNSYRETLESGFAELSAPSSWHLLASSASASRLGEEPKAGGGCMLTSQMGSRIFRHHENTPNKVKI